MAAQHLPGYLGGLAVDKETRSNERRGSIKTTTKNSGKSMPMYRVTDK